MKKRSGNFVRERVFARFWSRVGLELGFLLMKEEGNQDIELERERERERERETGEKNGLLARLLRDRMSSIEESSGGSSQIYLRYGEYLCSRRCLD